MHFLIKINGLSRKDELPGSKIDNNKVTRMYKKKRECVCVLPIHYKEKNRKGTKDNHVHTLFLVMTLEYTIMK
jgi:hypothetical protein